MTRALLITNPFAARADARAVTAILKILGRGGWNGDLRTIPGPGGAPRIAEEALGEGVGVVLRHGGGGTGQQGAGGSARAGLPLGGRARAQLRPAAAGVSQAACRSLSR